jgi:hypothetical protein
MARVCKSLNNIEQGYPHRDHRSKRGRKPTLRYDRSQRLKMARKLNTGKRKGKWIA